MESQAIDRYTLQTSFIWQHLLSYYVLSLKLFINTSEEIIALVIEIQTLKIVIEKLFAIILIKL